MSIRMLIQNYSFYHLIIFLSYLSIYILIYLSCRQSIYQSIYLSIYMLPICLLIQYINFNTKALTFNNSLSKDLVEWLRTSVAIYLSNWPSLKQSVWINQFDLFSFLPRINGLIFLFYFVFFIGWNKKMWFLRYVISVRYVIVLPLFPYPYSL